VKLRAVVSEPVPAAASLRAEVLAGLAQTPKAIPPKFFYDRRGSQLFERICELPEYYLTRTEIGILKDNVAELATRVGPRSVIIEPGCGAAHKVRLLLDALRPAAYVGVDISRESLLGATRRLAADYPWLRVRAVCADLCASLAHLNLPRGYRRVAFYPGSSIGNFEPGDAVRFLSRVRQLVGPDGLLLIGVDLKKDPAVLHAAYNDARGVTAEFNLNLLRRLRRELDARLDLSGFSHRAFYNEARGRIEMHLVSRRRQRLRIDGACFEMSEGETIHTENSYKYAREEFENVARAAGFSPERCWTDARRLFAVLLLSSQSL
jgi:dimethylhistidine N-methyltransferase